MLTAFVMTDRSKSLGAEFAVMNTNRYASKMIEIFKQAALPESFHYINTTAPDDSGVPLLQPFLATAASAPSDAATPSPGLEWR